MNRFTLAAFWSCFIAAAYAATGECSIPPLYLPWRNVTVSPDGLAVSRGVELGIGTPSQIFSLRPATTLNNTRISNILECVSAANISCIGAAGGVFNSTKSSTYFVTIKSGWNGSDADTETASGSYVYFNDDMRFERNGSVPGFPLVMYAGLDLSTTRPENGIPLGVDSSFLKAATKSGVAPTSAWSLWAGSRSLDPADGALVIGGFDNARVGGNFTTFPIGTWSNSQPCPLQVTVTHISYALPNGTETMLLNIADGPINACLDTSHQRFTFTPAVAELFGNVTQYNQSYPGLNYPVDKRPPGNLTIILDNGYKTTIPNEELFTIKRGSDEYGRYAITNTSIVETGISYNAMSDPAKVGAVLGGMFLTMNYLVVDYEAGSFQLAPAIQGQMGDDTRQLRSICMQKAGTVPTTGSTSGITAPTGSTALSGKGENNNKGAIAGGVVGGIAILVLIMAAILVFVRRSRKAKEEKLKQELGNTHRQSSIVSFSELPSPIAVHGLHELPSP